MSLSSRCVWGLSLGLLTAAPLGCSSNQPLTLLTPGPDEVADPGGASSSSTDASPGHEQDKAQPPASDAGATPGDGSSQPPSDGSTNSSSNTPPDDGSSPPADAWTTAPPLRGAVSLSDTDLAQQALTLMGSSAVGASGSCSNCHSLGRATLTHWAQLTHSFASACLSNPDLSDQAAVDAMLTCFQNQAGGAGAALAPATFGVYAAAAGLPWFEFVLGHASANGSDPAGAVSNFERQVGMPRAGEPWTQAQFDIVAEWFARNLPGLYDLIPSDSGEACSAGLDAALGTYVDSMQVEGWRAKNAEVPLLMFGCEAGQSGSACLQSLPRASQQSYGAGWENVPGTQLRILHDNSASRTTYWSRCSADGRFIGSGLENGGGSGIGGQFVDLLHNQTIAGHFAYDATFFPDNSGFLVQRGGYDDGSDNAPTDGHVANEAVAIACDQGVLTSDPSEVTGDESGCTLLSAKFGLYQQPAKSLDGSDYWVVHGSYQSDNGGFSPTLQDPSADFQADANVTLTPMVNQGNGFVAGEPSHIVTPHMGDPVLSPSGGLLVLRVKGAEYTTSVDGQDVVQASQSGYALYRVNHSGSAGSQTASLQDLGRICLQGGKATISYDERWLVFHHYVTAADATALGFQGPDDAAFAAYLSDGSSNLYLADLTTGNVQRITQMGAGQYALFPHFRSDGWIYFVVRTTGGDEYFAASDAALVAESQ